MKNKPFPNQVNEYHGKVRDVYYIDNELLVIDTESSMTMLGFEENKEQKNRDRIREILDRKKQQTV